MRKVIYLFLVQAVAGLVFFAYIYASTGIGMAGNLFDPNPLHKPVMSTVSTARK